MINFRYIEVMNYLSEGRIGLDRDSLLIDWPIEVGVASVVQVDHEEFRKGPLHQALAATVDIQARSDRPNEGFATLTVLLEA